MELDNQELQEQFMEDIIDAETVGSPPPSATPDKRQRTNSSPIPEDNDDEDVGLPQRQHIPRVPRRPLNPADPRNQAAIDDTALNHFLTSSVSNSNCTPFAVECAVAASEKICADFNDLSSELERCLHAFSSFRTLRSKNSYPKVIRDFMQHPSAVLNFQILDESVSVPVNILTNCTQESLFSYMHFLYTKALETAFRRLMEGDDFLRNMMRGSFSHTELLNEFVNLILSPTANTGLCGFSIYYPRVAFASTVMPVLSDLSLRLAVADTNWHRRILRLEGFSDFPSLGNLSVQNLMELVALPPAPVQTAPPVPTGQAVPAASTPAQTGGPSTLIGANPEAPQSRVQSVSAPQDAVLTALQQLPQLISATITESLAPRQQPFRGPDQSFNRPSGNYQRFRQQGPFRQGSRQHKPPPYGQQSSYSHDQYNPQRSQRPQGLQYRRSNQGSMHPNNMYR